LNVYHAQSQILIEDWKGIKHEKDMVERSSRLSNLSPQLYGF
jgi:hypothetical protein